LVGQHGATPVVSLSLAGAAVRKLADDTAHVACAKETALRNSVTCRIAKCRLLGSTVTRAACTKTAESAVTR
jgi:hypothetical protein